MYVLFGNTLACCSPFDEAKNEGKHTTFDQKVVGVPLFFRLALRTPFFLKTGQNLLFIYILFWHTYEILDSHEHLSYSHKVAEEHWQPEKW